MNTKLVWVLIALILIIGAGFAWYQMSGTTVAQPSTNTATTTDSTAGGNQKLNINVVCQSALAYMTFPSSKESDQFMMECIAGEHPEVIERYKQDNNLNGATI